MRVEVNTSSLPVYKKYRITSFICIFETSVQSCRAENVICVGLFHNMTEKKFRIVDYQVYYSHELVHTIVKLIT